MRKKTHSTVYQGETRLFAIATTSLLAVFFAYIYFVSVSVADVVIRKDVDRKINTLATEVSILETTYIEMQHAINNDVASNRGFMPATSKVFIDMREDETLVLRDN